MIRPYEIWWEAGIHHATGGIRALHVLQWELARRGFPSWMSYDRISTPEAIGIYPHVIHGNPAGYNRRVWWVLGKTTHTEPDALTYAWEAGLGPYPLLTVDIIERDLWYPRKGPRSGVAWYGGKGRAKADRSLLPEGATEITIASHPTREQLAAFVGRLDYLISFDTFSAINVEAVCAGTPVVILNSNGDWSPEEIERQGWLKYGVTRSLATLDEARASVGQAFAHYDGLRPVFAARIDDFIRESQRLLA